MEKFDKNKNETIKRKYENLKNIVIGVSLNLKKSRRK